jgi:hypothetical protein
MLSPRFRIMGGMVGDRNSKDPESPENLFSKVFGRLRDSLPDHRCYRTGSQGAKRSPLSEDRGLEAGDGVRTRDPQLGKLMLYQLSYSRAAKNLVG